MWSDPGHGAAPRTQRRGLMGVPHIAGSEGHDRQRQPCPDQEPTDSVLGAARLRHSPAEQHSVHQRQGVSSDRLAPIDPYAAGEQEHEQDDQQDPKPDSHISLPLDVEREVPNCAHHLNQRQQNPSSVNRHDKKRPEFSRRSVDRPGLFSVLLSVASKHRTVTHDYSEGKMRWCRRKSSFS